jgi:urease accessory protein
MNNLSLLNLLQLASPALPVGGYSYSDGLETLVEQGKINSPESLRHWLEQELRYGATRLEGAIVVRAYQSASRGDLEALKDWNAWVSAAKETAELREQSGQMGGSLLRLLLDLSGESGEKVREFASAVGSPCNYAIAFGIVAVSWDIPLSATLLGYLQSWASHLIGAGVKLIPLGQTVGQRLLLELSGEISHASQDISALSDDELCSCSWGLALASMAHETQYTRLFRS